MFDTGSPCSWDKSLWLSGFLPHWLASTTRYLEGRRGGGAHAGKRCAGVPLQVGGEGVWGYGGALCFAHS